MRTRKCARYGFRSEAGAAAAEFALVLVPLILLTFGIIEFARAFNTRNGLEYVADVASRDVMIGRYAEATSPAQLEALLTAHARERFYGGDSDLLALTVASGSGGTQQVITARYPFRFLIPFLNFRDMTLTASRTVPVRQ